MSHLRSLRTFCHLPAASFVGYPRTCRRLPRSFSLSTQLCSISAPSIQSAPLVFVLLSSLAALHRTAPLPLASALGMLQQRRTCRIDRQMLEHDVPVVFCQQRDRLRVSEEHVTDVADECFCCEVTRLRQLCTCTLAERTCTGVQLRWSDVRTRWRMLGTVLSGPQGFANSFGAMRSSHDLPYVRKQCLFALK